MKEIQSGLHIADSQSETIAFAKNILDSMLDWVCVTDRNGAVIFMNRSMNGYLQNNPDDADLSEIIDRYPSEDMGLMNYERIISAALNKAEPNKEVPIGDKVFAVMSSPLKNEFGETEYTVEVYRDITEQKYNERKLHDDNIRYETDLAMAKMLQRKLLPGASPNAHVSFHYLYRPCERLGGDFVDIYNIIGTDHMGVYIADVSGHGVAASILTVFLRSTISKRLTSPAEALTLLFNEFNKNDFESEVYITVFYAIYDLRTNTLTYANAGHNAIPVLYNKNNPEAQLFLTTPGLPISNWAESFTYSENSVHIEPGDRLFLYTDGLSELRNDDNALFGQDRINEALKELDGSKNHPSMLISMLNKAYRFANIKDESRQNDDITMSFVELR